MYSVFSAAWKKIMSNLYFILSDVTIVMSVLNDLLMHFFFPLCLSDYYIHEKYPMIPLLYQSMLKHALTMLPSMQSVH